MCGIFVSVAASEPKHPSEPMKTVLSRRGPDHAQTVTRTLKDPDTGIELYMVFHSTVLALRGGTVIPQPSTSSDSDSVLSWNGEAWSVSGRPVDGNDTTAILDGLEDAALAHSSSTEPRNVVMYRFLASIAGPFAFVFYDAPNCKLYFGRDALGRRSLMFRDDGLSFTISSCGEPDDEDGWKEVEPRGVSTIDLRSWRDREPPAPGPVNVNLLTWNQIGDLEGAFIPKQSSPYIERSVGRAGSAYVFDFQNVTKLRSQLLRSLHLRVRGIPTWKHRNKAPAKFDRFSQASHPLERVAILFSGGLDCTVLARLTHDVLPLHQPIVLLNIAFDNPRLAKMAGKEQSQYEQCPDRITARSSAKALQGTCMGRQWLFVAVNIPYEELVLHRDNVISLMRPHKTEMDLSIAVALYFASRGIGSLETESTICEYVTQAQVLLSGLGADELFGGYIRHENACKRGGIEALISELQLDIERIGTRNLGRDDRVTGHWAREIRYPFLDEALVSWVVNLPVWQKCRYGLDVPGTGARDVEAGKYLLRLLAQALGLQNAAGEKKRAIQFGTRSAKMFDRRTKGNDSILTDPRSSC